MKARWLMAALLFLTVVSRHFVATRVFAADIPATNSTGSIDVPLQAVNEINAMGRLLWELAAERYSANSNRGQIVILAAHEGKWPGKFTDGKYTVVTLPGLDPDHRVAICRYVSHYNTWNLQWADQQAMAGKYASAREVYELVLHFDKCGGLFREEAEKKLALIRKLEKGVDPEANRKELRELSLTYAAHLGFSKIEEMSAMKVTNLLDSWIR